MENSLDNRADTGLKSLRTFSENVNLTWLTFQSISCPKPERFFVFLSIHFTQDGRIDYNEFVAMMQKGTIGGNAKKGIQSTFSFGFREGRKA